MPCIKAILCDPVGLPWPMTQATQTMEIRAPAVWLGGRDVPASCNVVDFVMRGLIGRIPRRRCTHRIPCPITTSELGTRRHASPVPLTFSTICSPTDGARSRAGATGEAWQGHVDVMPRPEFDVDNLSPMTRMRLRP